MEKLLRYVLLMAWMPSLAWAQTQPEGWSGDHHLIVVGMDTSKVYLAQADASLSVRDALRSVWSVWSAPRMGGALEPLDLIPFRAEAWSSLGNIQHVAMDKQGKRAVLSAQRSLDEAGDYDLFVSHELPRKRRSEPVRWSVPVPLDGLNSVADEVLPHWDREGSIRFATNASGTFQLRQASWRTQWLRDEPLLDELVGGQEACVAMTAGPGLTWLSRVSTATGLLEVVPLPVPDIEAALPEGWSLCLTLPEGVTWEGGEAMVVRQARSGNVQALLPLGEDGCTSLAGLPANETWEFQWQVSSWKGEVHGVVASVLSPAGEVVRTYNLDGASGWKFTFLPLDDIAALAFRHATDGSGWPWVPVQLVHFELGEAQPIDASLQGLAAWLTMAPQLEEGRWELVGHADMTGTDELNAALSLARAEEVSGWMQGHLGLTREQFSVAGEGSSMPLSEDPARNRRVEVRWVPAMQ